MARALKIHIDAHRNKFLLDAETDEDLTAKHGITGTLLYHRDTCWLALTAEAANQVIVFEEPMVPDVENKAEFSPSLGEMKRRVKFLRRNTP